MRISLPTFFLLVLLSFSVFSIGFSQMSYNEALQVVKEQVNYLFNGSVAVLELSKNDYGVEYARLCDSVECAWVTLTDIASEYTSAKNTEYALTNQNNLQFINEQVNYLSGGTIAALELGKDDYGIEYAKLCDSIECQWVPLTNITNHIATTRNVAQPEHRALIDEEEKLLQQMKYEAQMDYINMWERISEKASSLNE